MDEENNTLTIDFILIGFTNYPEMKVVLFVVFLIIYLITIIGNLGLVILISIEPQLHTPMYFFLGNLALLDACCGCAVTPNMLVNLFSKNRMISIYECMTQFYFLCVVETSDCFLLAAMAYDRYVAICNPLHYPIIMSKKLCIQMLIVSYLGGTLTSVVHVGFVFRLIFCRSHRINHFFCDVIPLFRLSCVDPYINELMMYIFSGSILVFTIVIILVSYLYILFTIFRMKSKDGRGKAFSTCASHFVSVSIFYGSLLFMYIRPGSVNEGDKNMPIAIFYTIVIPFLNPFIYSLRNKEVISVLKKTLKKKMSGYLKQNLFSVTY
ncbi:olfactory receptor 5K1-like [Antechinus flavipes]|uniref:olfactory receptor 5K1-like n=1 Tax=Antechinus flavipes TaxID=38775 RepID=UPI002235E81D|nr:olfactory receptor 5K1-like [Antechinus flavipes]